MRLTILSLLWWNTALGCGSHATMDPPRTDGGTILVDASDSDTGIDRAVDAGLEDATTTPIEIETTSASGTFLVSSASHAARYGVFEMTIRHDEAPYANVWEDLAVVATFTSPNGANIVIDGFYYDTNTWKVRFAPWELGSYAWTVSLGADAAGGSVQVEETGNLGFIRTHPDNPYRLIHESDESSYQGLGFSTCLWNQCIRDGREPGPGCDSFWLEQENGYSLDEFLDAMVGETGANLLRWSVANCSSFALWENIDDDENVYNVVNGKWGDYFIEALRARGVRIFLDPVGFGWMSLVDLNQREGLKRYYRYVVARYGAYVDFWELMNEHGLHGLDEAWVTEMSTAIKEADPYDHLVSMSYARPDIAGVDVNAPHVYTTLRYFDADIVSRDIIIQGYTPELFPKAQYPKPIFWGEAGESFGQPTLGPFTQVTTRVKLWMTLFYEAYPIFWELNWNPDGEAALYFDREVRGYFGARQRVGGRFDADARPVLTPTSTATGGNGIRVHELRGAQDVYLYLYNPSNDPIPMVSDARVTVDIARRGLATWYDTVTGDSVDSVPVEVGRVTLDVPEFTLDTVLVIEGE